MNARRLQLYGFLFFLTLVSWWLVQIESPKVEQTPTAHDHVADFFSLGYVKTEMDGEGKPKNRLIADKLVHFSDDNTTELTRPEMTFFYPDSSTWVIRSDSGWVSADGKDVLLNGTVHIDRDKTAGLRPVHVRTSSLKVKPEKSYAETEKWVEINNPPDRTEGVGMQIYFSKPIHLKLLSKVRGKYGAN
ncbi:MAG: LPS export ABC transporter periplasmic protein LptC [Gammaproteobacteria bacterium]